MGAGSDVPREPPAAIPVGTATAGFTFLSRRRLLKLGVAALAVPVSGLGGLAVLRGGAPDVPALAALDDHTFRTLLNLARTHLPPGAGFASGKDPAQLAMAFDRYLADEPAGRVSDLRTALRLLEFGPLLFDRRLTTFSNLPATDQLVHWQAWMQSDLLLRRQIALAFRKFMGLVFFDDPAVWPHLGYPGPRPSTNPTPGIAR